MRLYIDNIEVDINEQMVGVSYLNDNIEDIETLVTSTTTPIDVPMTPLSMSVFGHADDLHRERFNNSFHTARLEDDTVIASGFAHLIRSVRNDGISYYQIEIIGAGKLWAVYASTHFLKDLYFSLSMDDIESAWSVRGLQMFPVQRPTINSKFSLTDLHPFLNIRDVFEQIYSEAGYSVSSTFISQLDKLYFNPQVKEQDQEKMHLETGFKAGRLYSIETVGNASSTLLSLVDTASGDDLFNSGSFSLVGLNPTFTALTTCAVQYLLKIQLTTEFKLTPTGGQYSHSIGNYVKELNFGGYTTEFTIEPNIILLEKQSSGGHIFRKTGITTNSLIFGLKIVLDGYISSPEPLRLNIYDKVGGGVVDTFDYPFSELGNELLYKSVLSAFAQNICLEILWYDSINNKWKDIDQTIINTVTFNEYQDEYTFNAEILSRHPGFTPTEQCAVFSFAPLNVSSMPYLIIDGSTTLETIFSPLLIGTNQTLDCTYFTDDFTLLDFIKAVKHIFNLRFITDEKRKIVYIEPRATLNTGGVRDWTEKIDYSKSIEIEELKIGKSLIVGYQSDDASVQDFNSLNPELGLKKYPLLHKYMNEDYELRNDIFSTSISGESLFNSSVKLLRVDNEGNFSTRLVEFSEVKTVDVNGLYPSTTAYPLVAFSDSLEGIDLGFASLGSYDINAYLYDNSRRVTLYLHLKPLDIEPFIECTTGDFRAIYQLDLPEKGLYYLESINDYTPYKSVKCTFIKL